MDDPLDVSQDDPMEGLMDSEQRRWTLLSQKYDGYGWEDEVFDGPELSHGERIEVCPVSELDAALATIDALRAELAEVRGTLSASYAIGAELALQLAAERAHADRLAEALRYTWPGLGEDRKLGGDVSVAHRLAVDALSAHDARRQPAKEGGER